MSRTATLFLIAGPMSVLAQPVIDVPNLPVVGDITTIGLCDDSVDAEALNAASGAMVTWDFSGLNETSEEHFTFVDPFMFAEVKTVEVSFQSDPSGYIDVDT